MSFQFWLAHLLVIYRILWSIQITHILFHAGIGKLSWGCYNFISIRIYESLYRQVWHQMWVCNCISIRASKLGAHSCQHVINMQWPTHSLHMHGILYSWVSCIKRKIYRTLFLLHAFHPEPMKNLNHIAILFWWRMFVCFCMQTVYVSMYTVYGFFYGVYKNNSVTYN